MPTIQRCTAQLGGGQFCDAESMEGAPFPICLPHATAVWKAVQKHIQNPKPAYRRPLKSDAPSEGLVYYLLVGDRVKIGFTTNLHRRLQTLSLTRREVAATEKGSETLEYRRHQQFDTAHISYEREWFRATPELLEHIASLT